MREHLDLVFIDRTENHVRVMVRPCVSSPISQVAGIIRGPYSDFSKTLTADSRLRPLESSGWVETLIVEPCYWTPQLPFWYDLRLIVTFDDGSSRETVVPFGINRFFCERGNFLLEGKRVVLRGLTIAAPASDQYEAAREYETALIVSRPTVDTLQAASRLGVPLLLDWRDIPAVPTTILHWYPAVMLVLLAAEQYGTVQLRGVPSAVYIAGDAGVPDVACDAYAIELQPGESPPSWAATSSKPVIAIRRDLEAEIVAARDHCDVLQATLAPEFDLEDYFV